MFRWEADLTSFPVVHYLVVNQVLEKTLRPPNLCQGFLQCPRDQLEYQFGFSLKYIFILEKF